MTSLEVTIDGAWWKIRILSHDKPSMQIVKILPFDTVNIVYSLNVVIFIFFGTNRLKSNYYTRKMTVNFTMSKNKQIWIFVFLLKFLVKMIIYKYMYVCVYNLHNVFPLIYLFSP